MRYSLEEKIFINKKYHILGSTTLVQRAWRTKFVCSKAPDHSTILYIARQYEKNGSVQKLTRKNKNNRHTNQHKYLDMIANIFWSKFLRTENYKNYYFQQDGAICHTANKVQEWSKSKFGAKFIDKKSWSPRSPDLNPCDFCLWGYLKAKV